MSIGPRTIVFYEYLFNDYPKPKPKKYKISFVATGNISCLIHHILTVCGDDAKVTDGADGVKIEEVEQ